MNDIRIDTNTIKRPHNSIIIFRLLYILPCHFFAGDMLERLHLILKMPFYLMNSLFPCCFCHFTETETLLNVKCHGEFSENFPLITTANKLTATSDGLTKPRQLKTADDLEKSNELLLRTKPTVDKE